MATVTQRDRERAREILQGKDKWADVTVTSLENFLAQAIADERERERERCAGVAGTRRCPAEKQVAWWGRPCGESIAAAIRRGAA